MRQFLSRRRIAVLSLVAVGSLAAGGTVVAQGRFPNLNNAEGHLNAALSDLERAPDRFGGHRAEAIRLVRAAIGEIQRAKSDFH